MSMGTWETLSISGWLGNIAVLDRQVYDIFRLERYLSGLPVNPILNLYGVRVQSIRWTEDLEPQVNTILQGMPDNEMPTWLRNAFKVYVAFSTLVETANRNGGDIVISGGDPWVPSVSGRSYRILPIGGDDVINNNWRFRVLYPLENAQDTWEFNILADRDTGNAIGEHVLPARIYDYFSSDVGKYFKQWHISVLEWFRLPTVTNRNPEIQNIPAPEVQVMGQWFTSPLHLGADLRGWGVTGVEIGIESPYSQTITVKVRDLSNFTNVLGQGQVQIGSFVRFRIRSRSPFQRLPPIAVSLYPRRQMKVAYIRILTWRDMLFGR
jgi:hypothetical protein